MQTPFTKIPEILHARGIKVAYATVRRAYDYAHADELRESIESDKPLDRGSWNLIGHEKYQQIEQLLLEGKLNPKQIANLVGCGVSTVRRAQKKLTKPGEGHLSQRQSA